MDLILLCHCKAECSDEGKDNSNWCVMSPPIILGSRKKKRRQRRGGEEET